MAPTCWRGWSSRRKARAAVRDHEVLSRSSVGWRPAGRAAQLPRRSGRTTTGSALKTTDRQALLPSRECECLGDPVRDARNGRRPTSVNKSGSAVALRENQARWVRPAFRGLGVENDPYWPRINPGPREVADEPALLPGGIYHPISEMGLLFKSSGFQDIELRVGVIKGTVVYTHRSFMRPHPALPAFDQLGQYLTESQCSNRRPPLLLLIPR